jgi:hypothetical protein
MTNARFWWLLSVSGSHACTVGPENESMERANQILSLYLSPDAEMSAQVWAVWLDRAQQSGPGAI